MAKQRARQVKRDGGSMTRSTIAIASSQRKPYEIPDYAKDIMVANMGWVVLAALVVMAPAAILGIVLGFHALPLEFIGVPGTANSAGFNIIAPIAVASLLALAIRPLFRLERKGWGYLISAALAFFANQLYLGHGITSGVILLAVLYLYVQIRRRYH